MAISQLNSETNIAEDHTSSQNDVASTSNSGIYSSANAVRAKCAIVFLFSSAILLVLVLACFPDGCNGAVTEVLEVVLTEVTSAGGTITIAVARLLILLLLSVSRPG
mgnify:CR=1 FL=1